MLCPNFAFVRIKKIVRLFSICQNNIIPLDIFFLFKKKLVPILGYLSFDFRECKCKINKFDVHYFMY